MDHLNARDPRNEERSKSVGSLDSDSNASNVIDNSTGTLDKVGDPEISENT